MAALSITKLFLIPLEQTKRVQDSWQEWLVLTCHIFLKLAKWIIVWRLPPWSSHESF